MSKELEEKMYALKAISSELQPPRNGKEDFEMFYPKINRALSGVVSDVASFTTSWLSSLYYAMKDNPCYLTTGFIFQRVEFSYNDKKQIQVLAHCEDDSFLMPLLSKVCTGKFVPTPTDSDIVDMETLKPSSEPETTPKPTKPTKPAETKKAETKKAEPAKPVKPKPEPVKAKPEPVKAKPEPVKAKPEPVKAKPEPVKAEPKSEPVKAKPEPVKAEPKSEPVKAVKPRKKPAKTKVEVEVETPPTVAESKSEAYKGLVTMCVESFNETKTADFAKGLFTNNLEQLYGFTADEVSALKADIEARLGDTLDL